MKSKDIIRKVVADIFSGKLNENDKLPSEQQLAIKYNVSRIVATKAYQVLIKIGAVYSVPKKGFFISENFSGIVRDVGVEYNSNKHKDYDFSISKINSEEYTYFRRDYFKDDKKIIVSENYLSSNYSYDELKDPLSSLIWSDEIDNAIKTIYFGEFKAFGKQTNLIVETKYYSKSGIPFFQKAVINPKIFKLTKIEWAI